jgi:hypothetical protein
MIKAYVLRCAQKRMMDNDQMNDGKLRELPDSDMAAELLEMSQTCEADEPKIA